MRYLAGLAGFLVAGFAVPAWADHGPDVAASGVAAGKLGEVLVVFLVLAVILEVALTPVFNSRWYARFLEGRGCKIPITISLALYIFWSYDLDIVRDVLVALGHPADLSLTGQILTAILIAGGSDGVYRIFTKLGIRNPLERTEKAKEARKEAAPKKNLAPLAPKAAPPSLAANVKRAAQQVESLGTPYLAGGISPYRDPDTDTRESEGEGPPIKR